MIPLPYKYMPIREVKTQIIKKKSLTHDVIEFVLRPEEKIEYVSGQYVMLRIPTEEGKFVFRAYSLANTPQDKEDGLIRLVIKILPGGTSSEFLKSTRVGDEIQLRGGLGFFTYKSPNAKNIYFIGTGTGIAPLISMISNSLQLPANNVHFKFFWGNRFKVDIFWQDYLENLKKEYPNFDYKLALSQPVGYWEGTKGYVTELLKSEEIDFQEGHFYLCGIPQMVEDAHNLLLSHGVSEDRIFSEKFTSLGKALSQAKDK